jgi:glycosyltransferase involved in cell wall biosynthesis
MASNTDRILIIVPAYNEEASIRATVKEILAFFPREDVLVVNDGSDDRTTEFARMMGVNVVDFPLNLGIGGAVQAGFKYAVRRGYKYAVQVDADGQHPADQIAILLHLIRKGEADVVIGSRFSREIGEIGSGYIVPFSRLLGMKVFKFLNSLILRQSIQDNTSGFRAYNKSALHYLAKEYPQDYPEPEVVVMLGLSGFRLKEVFVQMRQREIGTSSITPFRAIYYMVKVTLAIFIHTIRGSQKVR